MAQCPATDLAAGIAALLQERRLVLWLAVLAVMLGAT